MNKDVLRKVYLEKRTMLSEREWKRRSQLIADHFLSVLETSETRCIHVYLPMLDRKEPDTRLLIPGLMERGICVAVSRTDWRMRSMKHFEYEGEHQLETGRFGIPEPKGGRNIPDEEIDLILVPMITFDLKGNRIGYGGGFYDRFMASVPSCKKVGYTICVPLDSIIYKESFDIPMDACVYPYGILNFK